jgi:signal transduction histidine kinase
VRFRIAVADEIVLAINPVDFLEVAGNILENAGEYAAAEVSVSAYIKDGMAEIRIEDDGPAVPEAGLRVCIPLPSA